MGRYDASVARYMIYPYHDFCWALMHSYAIEFLRLIMCCKIIVMEKLSERLLFVDEFLLPFIDSIRDGAIVDRNEVDIVC